ncbi:MAG: hypothetical protein ABIJ46_01670 [bacterium]
MTDGPTDSGMRQDRDGQGDRRRGLLAVAVVVTMIFVVGAWLLLLPYQIDRAAIGDQADVGWDSVRENLDQQALDFRKSLDGLGEELVSEDAAPPPEGSGGKEADGRTGPDLSEISEIAERLQEKLAAAESAAVETEQKQ